MKLFVTIFASACLSVSCVGQDSTVSVRVYKTDSHIIQDKRMNEMILKQIMINEERKGKIQGYRVQIHFGAEKSKAIEVRKEFKEEFRDIPAYLDYQQPYFKIRTGNLRTRLEAYKLQMQIKDKFPGAFIVRDEIEPEIN